MNILNIIKNLIKGGKQSKVADDSKSTTIAAVDFLGQTRDVRQITPYGFYCSPVLGCNWVIFSNRANSDDLRGIGNDYENRPKDLVEGEVVLQNLLTGAYIKLLENGDIEVITEANIIAKAANITATAAANATINATNIIANASAAATITAPTITASATTATVTAANINLVGTVNVTGSLIVNGIVFETHRHAPNNTPPSNP